MSFALWFFVGFPCYTGIDPEVLYLSVSGKRTSESFKFF